MTRHIRIVDRTPGSPSITAGNRVAPPPSAAELIEELAERHRSRAHRAEQELRLVDRRARYESAEIVARAACDLPAHSPERLRLEALVVEIENGGLTR